MANQPSQESWRFPNFEDNNNKVRRRHPTEREPPSPGSNPRNDYALPGLTRTKLTSDRLTNYDTDTETQDLDVTEVRQDEPLPRSVPSPSSRSTVDIVASTAARVAHQSFVGGAHLPQKIPDPEEPPTPTIEPDDSEHLAAGPLPWIREKVSGHPRPKSTQEVVDKVLEQFRPRASLPVQVIDFYEYRAERKLISIAEIESCMARKPKGVLVRWIHAPLGIGLFHSSVEDIFLRGPAEEDAGHWRRLSKPLRGKSFEKAGRAGWPYLETEILNVRSTKQMEEARNTAQALLNDEQAQRILNRRVFDDDHNTANPNPRPNPTLTQDVKWRSDHIGKSQNPSYWDTVYSDLPLLMSDGALIMKSPAATNQQPSLKMKKLMLQEDPAYQYAYLARDPFRCFHRSDGFLLSLSPSTGIDYLNRHLPKITEDPKGHVNHWRPESTKRDDDDEDDFKFPSASLSVIAHIYAEFKDNGTQRWEFQTAEWLMVFLMTEIACTPHSMRSGYSVATILDAYDTQVSKLIERKFEPWARYETAELFHSYLKTIDELRTLGRIYERKLEFLKRLREDCAALQHELADENATNDTNSVDIASVNGDSPIITITGRVQFALRAVSDLSAQCKELHTDLTSSYDLMSRLRAVEQNDLGISADAQGRAILILSAVTIIFLPLSFLASFFSMNVQGISETPPPTTLGQFGKICGVVTAVLVVFVWTFLWRVSAGNNARAWPTILRRNNHNAI